MFKTNEYFDGAVKSIAFNHAGLPATIGVMAAGEYQFGTSQKEIMTVVSGALEVLLLGHDRWACYAAGQSFTVEANQSFAVKVASNTTYLCEYH